MHANTVSRRSTTKLVPLSTTIDRFWMAALAVANHPDCTREIKAVLRVLLVGIVDLLPRKRNADH